MSLEKTIEANTIALQNLIQVVQDLTDAMAHKPVSEKPISAAAEIGKAAAAAGKAVEKAIKPSAEKATEVKPKVEEPKPDETKPDVEDPTKRVWTYDELAKDFLVLLKENRTKALAILESLKIASLKEIKGQEMFYHAVAAKIQEARNG